MADTLQTLMGSNYVNDFDFNDRSYRVYVQADSAFRMRPQDIGRYYVRTPRGDMVRLDVEQLDLADTTADEKTVLIDDAIQQQ